VLKKLSYTVFIPLLVIMLLTFGAGCEKEEESYSIETDEEFQQVVDETLERFFREEDTGAIYEELYEKFSDRYTEEEIYGYIETKVKEEEEELRAQEERLKQSKAELEEQVSDYKDQLEELSDQAAMEEVDEQLEPLTNWIENLEEEMEGTTDPYRSNELMN